MANGAFGGGDGSQNDPFLIEDVLDFKRALNTDDYSEAEEDESLEPGYVWYTVMNDITLADSVTVNGRYKDIFMLQHNLNLEQGCEIHYSNSFVRVNGGIVNVNMRSNNINNTCVVYEGTKYGDGTLAFCFESCDVNINIQSSIDMSTIDTRKISILNLIGFYIFKCNLYVTANVNLTHCEQGGSTSVSLLLSPRIRSTIVKFKGKIVTDAENTSTLPSSSSRHLSNITILNTNNTNMVGNKASNVPPTNIYRFENFEIDNNIDVYKSGSVGNLQGLIQSGIIIINGQMGTPLGPTNRDYGSYIDGTFTFKQNVKKSLDDVTILRGSMYAVIGRIGYVNYWKIDFTHNIYGASGFEKWVEIVKGQTQKIPTTDGSISPALDCDRIIICGEVLNSVLTTPALTPTSRPRSARVLMTNDNALILFTELSFGTFWGLDPNINEGYPYLIDIQPIKPVGGLFVQGKSGTIQIPTYSLSDVSGACLRFNAGDEIRVIKLVATTDSNALPIRVQTSSGVMSLSK